VAGASLPAAAPAVAGDALATGVQPAGTPSPEATSAGDPR